MEAPISPPRVSRRGKGTTRYEKEIAGTPKLADDPHERKWIGPWLMGDTIGKGASGRVRLARHKRTGKLAAIKIIPKIHLSGNGSRVDHKAERVMHSIRREMVVMKLIHHPHIMDMYDVYEDENELYLLLEYVEGGELFDYLVSKGRLEPNEALSYFKQIISGVDYCHRFNICHRDLKPENLLLDKDRNIKIADFGMAALELQNGMGFLETSCGSPHYASPEIVAGRAYHGAASDIWSCGVVLYALLAGRLPFDHEDMGTLLRLVKAGRYDMPSSFPRSAQDLISRMLVVDPSKRITMKRILTHPFFTLEFTPRVPILSPPPFLSIAQRIPSRDLIDRQILENLTTLFRGVHREEVIANLLSSHRTWEKAFYHLLKEYHERQSEEYGDGMSFVDFTGREEPVVISTNGKRSSAGTSSGSGSGSGTSQGKGRATAEATSGALHFESRRDSDKSGSARNDVTKDPMIATRDAPVPSRRHRATVGGPRSPTPKEPTTHPTHPPSPRGTASGSITPRPAHPGSRSPEMKSEAPPPVVTRAEAVGRNSPTSTTTGGASSSVPLPLPIPPPPSPSPASIEPSTANPRQQKQRIEQRLLEQRLRNANVMASTTGAKVNDDGRPPTLDLDLGLALPSPPAASPVPSATAPSESPKKRSSVAGPRPLLHSPRTSKQTEASPITRPVETKAQPLSDLRLEAQETTVTKPRHANKETRLSKDYDRPERSSLAVPKSHHNHAEDSPFPAAYPSPPPSQASGLEPLLAFQQSPVFTDRFSLHLDAMLPAFKAPTRNSHAYEATDQPSSQGLGLTIEDSPKRESSDVGEWEVINAVHAVTEGSTVVLVPNSHKRGSSISTFRPLPLVPEGLTQVQSQSVEADSASPSPSTQSSSALSIDHKNVPAATAPTITGETAGYNGVAHGKSNKENSSTNGARAPRSVSLSTPDTQQAPPSGKHGGKHRPAPLDLSKKRLTRMSTFVAAPPSPAPTPTLEPVGVNWFSQLFHVKPAVRDPTAYEFQSRDSLEKTRKECAALLRSFGVSVMEVESSDKRGLLKCHVDYIQEVSGKMIVNKPVTFRAQIIPHFSAPSFQQPVSPFLAPASSISPAPPLTPVFSVSEHCTLCLIQERGAKSTLEVVALRLRQEWRLDSLRSEEVSPMSPTSPNSINPRQSPKFPFLN